MSPGMQRAAPAFISADERRVNRDDERLAKSIRDRTGTPAAGALRRAFVARRRLLALDDL